MKNNLENVLKYNNFEKKHHPPLLLHQTRTLCNHINNYAAIIINLFATPI